MKVRLLGSKKLDFTSNDGSLIQGTQIFMSFPEEGVKGERCDKLFVKDGFALPPLKPGELLDISFNNKGKPESIKPAAKQVNIPNA